MKSNGIVEKMKKALCVLMSALLIFTLWGAVESEQAEAATGETGGDLSYDMAVGAFNGYALMTTRSESKVDNSPSIQFDQALVSADGEKKIVSEKHIGSGSGRNSAVQIAGILGQGQSIMVSNIHGMFGVAALDGSIIVPIEYATLERDESSGAYYCIKSLDNKVVLDSYDSAGNRNQSLDAGEGEPVQVAVFPGYVQVVKNVTDPDSKIGGTVRAAKVFAITQSGLVAEPEIVAASANDDSGCAYIKHDGSVWYKPANGQPSQIAVGANTGAMFDLLQATYSKIAYPKGNSVAYVTSAGAPSSEGVISAMADRVLALQGTVAQLGTSKDKLIAELSGSEFLWEEGIIVGYIPNESQGTYQFWVYSAYDGKLLEGPITSSTQVALERQDGNYAITYMPIDGSQVFAGLYFDKNLNLVSSNSAPSPLGGTLPDGRTIQVVPVNYGTSICYQVCDIYGSPIYCGNYVLSLGVVSGPETQGAGSATCRVQHGNSNLYCAMDANGNYGAVDADGNVFVPFIYDNYYDLGYMGPGDALNESSYVMVHRDGQWFFFDVKNAKEILPPAAPTVKRTSISKARVSIRQREYRGKRLYPRHVVVRLHGKKLVKGRDYRVSCRGGRYVGRYRVTITGIGRYKGRIRSYFKIVPKGSRIRRLDRYHRAFRVTWKRNLRQTTGYQVRYSKDRRFKRGVNYRYVRGYRRASIRIGHLRAHRRYYVQVRTYKKVHGKKYFSVWSKRWVVRTR